MRSCMNQTGRWSAAGPHPKTCWRISYTRPGYVKHQWKLRLRDRNPKNMANITVTVYDSTENKRVPVELPDDAPANRIIAVLVDKLQLPQSGPDGAPLSYKFHHKNSGRQIQDSQTLADAAVKEGDILRLQPEITAGAR